MIRTYYIVPAWSDQAGQCRIVSANGRIPNPRDHYETSPNMWKDSGIMNSSGKVVCLDCGSLFHEMNQDAPLMAGVVYYTSAKRTTEQDRRM